MNSWADVVVRALLDVLLLGSILGVIMGVILWRGRNR